MRRYPTDFGNGVTAAGTYDDYNIVLVKYNSSGVALMGTFITSIAGAFFFAILPASGGTSSMPDWPLGILFGAGGFLGMYLGARAQKHMPQRTIKAIVGIAILLLAVRYITQYF